MNQENLAELFVNEFTKYKPLLAEQLEYNGELLLHVFFGECNDYFIELFDKGESEELKEFLSFFEKMATEGDVYVKELLSVTNRGLSA